MNHSCARPASPHVETMLRDAAAFASFRSATGRSGRGRHCGGRSRTSDGYEDAGLHGAPRGTPGAAADADLSGLAVGEFGQNIPKLAIATAHCRPGWNATSMAGTGDTVA